MSVSVRKTMNDCCRRVCCYGGRCDGEALEGRRGSGDEHGWREEDQSKEELGINIRKGTMTTSFRGRPSENNERLDTG